MISVILGTYNRGHLLRRSLQAYEKVKDLRLIVYDDGSRDGTDKLIQDYTGKSVYTFMGENQGWRDSASYLNGGIMFAIHKMRSDYVFITHPEIIIGQSTIDDAVALAKDNNTWVSCKGYYLTPEQQQHIDSVKWYNDLLEVRKLPNFYGNIVSPEFEGREDYLPESIERHDVWHSWIFAGGHRDMWLRFGGLTPFETWGSVDMDLHMRRAVGGIHTVTPNNETAYVVHQNHDEIAQRDMQKAMANLPSYSNQADCFKPHLIHDQDAK